MIGKLAYLKNSFQVFHYNLTSKQYTYLHRSKKLLVILYLLHLTLLLRNKNTCSKFQIIISSDFIMQAENNNRQILTKEWNAIYNSKAAKFVLVSNVDGYRYRKEGKHFVIGNKHKVQKKVNDLQAEAKKSNTVFMQFDSTKFSFSNASTKEILFHVNLDEEEIITKEHAAKITESFFDKQEGEQHDQIEGHSHPVLINTTPICPLNCILAMYPDEQLPQIIGQDIVLLLLNIFKIFPNIKVAYNSLGGGSTVNNLHFHLFYSEDLIGEQKLPIESENRTEWKKSTLVNPTEQINLYNVGVKISQIDTSMCYAWVLSPLGQNNEPSEIANSMSFVFGLIVNELIELCIPHNVLFSENGNSIYIILREFGDEKQNYGWLEFSGVAWVDYETKQDQILKVKSKMRVDQGHLEVLKKNVAKHLAAYK